MTNFRFNVNQKARSCKRDVLTIESLETRTLMSAAPWSTAPVEAVAPSETAIVETVDMGSEFTESSVLLDAPEAVAGKTWTISSTADTNTSGTLRYALENASAGDKITFASSMKGKTITLSGTELKITQNVTIDASNLEYGNGDPGLTINANNLSRCLSVESGTTDVTIAGIKFTGGNNVRNGGAAIYNLSKGLTLKQCVITGNTYYNAYAICSYLGASITMKECAVYENNCGGITASRNGTATFEDCTFARNLGTGVYSNNVNLTMNRCIVEENTSASQGAGVWCVGGVNYITDCVISGNIGTGTGHSFCGGGVCFSTGTLTIRRTVIASNQSKFGGGIGAQGNLNLYGVTITDNTATTDGGGINFSGRSALVMEIDSETGTFNTISDNRVINGFGGGIYNSGSAYVYDTAITGNYANTGGGICSYINIGSNYRLTLGNVLLAENSTSSVPSSGSTNAGYGGGIYSASALEMRNCTVTNNSAYDGGGFFAYSGSSYVYNSILTGNSASKSRTGTKDLDRETTYSKILEGYNNLSTYTGWTSGSSNSTYSSGSLFESDYTLKNNSQTVNKGNNSYAVNRYNQKMSHDLNGNNRIVGGTVDLGAMEYGSTSTIKLVTEASLSTETPKVGSAITVRVEPSDATYSCQWSYSSSPSGTFQNISGATSKTYTPSDALEGKYLRCTVTGTGEYKGSVSATTSGTVESNKVKLSAPSSLNLTASATSISASWNSVSGATSYTVQYRASTSSQWTTKNVSGTYCTFSVNGGGTYEVSVKANGTGIYISSDFTTRSVAIPEPLGKISAKATYKGDDNYSVAVSGISASATHLQVTINSQTAYVALNGTSTKVGSISCSFKNGILQFTNAQSNTKYTVQIAQATLNGSSVASVSVVVKVSVQTTKTCWNVPTNVQVKAVSDTQVTVSWNAVTGKGSSIYAGAYKVEYSIPGTNKWKAATSKAAGTSFTVSKLKGGATYEFRVQAAKDSRFLASDYSSTATATTQPTAPKFSSVSSKYANSATLTWKEMGGVESYKIQYKVSYESSWKTVTVSTQYGKSLTYTLSDLTSGLSCDFRIASVSWQGETSAWSAVKTLKKVK